MDKETIRFNIRYLPLETHKRVRQAALDFGLSIEDMLIKLIQTALPTQQGMKGEEGRAENN